jgi:hypothetical protein
MQKAITRQHDMRQYFSSLGGKNQSQRELYWGLTEMAGDIVKIYDRIYEIEQNYKELSQQVRAIRIQLNPDLQKKRG